MTLEKKWATEYRRLLPALTEAWGGELDGPATATGDWYVYPTYRAEVGGLPLQVEISETPGGSGSPFESADNIEYLRVSVPVGTPHELGVTQENLLDKIRKTLRLDWEFQTGAEEFDRRYWLNPRSERDRELLCDVRFQTFVTALEPFTLLQLRPVFVRAARELTDAAMLEIEPVRAMVECLLAIVGLIRSRDD